MERSGFAVSVPVELIDRLRAEGGNGLVGFYMSLASYVKGKSRVRGQLLFESQARAIAAIGIDKKTFQKYFGILKELELAEVDPARGLIIHKCAVHFADKAPIVLIGEKFPPINQEEHNNNGNMDTMQDNEDQGAESDPGSRTIVLDPSDPDAQSQQFIYIMGSLLERESIKRGEQPSWIQQQLKDKLDIYHSMVPLAYVHNLQGGPNIKRLAGGLLTADRDLAIYALEYIAHQHRPLWSGVETMLERWAENNITSVAQAMEDHERRKEQAQDRQRPPFTVDAYRTYIRKAMESGATYEEFCIRDDALPTYQFIPALTRRRRKAIIKKAFHGARNGGGAPDGRG